MKISTERFARLLAEATSWDENFPALRDAQKKYLITNFIFSDTECVHATPEDRRRWDIPLGAGRWLYTRCG